MGGQQCRGIVPGQHQTPFAGLDRMAARLQPRLRRGVVLGGQQNDAPADTLFDAEGVSNARIRPSLIKAMRSATSASSM